MELGSGRSSLEQQLRRGGRDRISALSDDMLLLIVAKLGCARDAVRTAVLSRRWRGIFALHRATVTEIAFRDVAFSSLEAELGRVCLCQPSTTVYSFRTRVHGTCVLDERGHHSLHRAMSRLEAREYCLYDGPGRCKGATVLRGCFHNQLPGSIRATTHVYLKPAFVHRSQNCPST